MQLGNWQLDTAGGGAFLLDGGAMFGVVPKPLWQKQQPADERNRIRLRTNCVLARDGTHTALVDTGYGGKLSEREREIFDAQQGQPLLESLAALGVSADDVDTVVFSHLHFDHAGGGTFHTADGALRPTFPRATYVAQRVEWADATGGAPELEGSYPLENLLPLEAASQLRLIDGDVEIVPGLRSLVTGGHTQGHQALVFSSGGQTAIYLGDLCPTHSHLPTMWCMGYDVYPLDTRRRKLQVLAQAADNGWLVLWDHDPDMAACRLTRDDRGRFTPGESFVTL